MRIAIICDTAACIRAGLEPATHLDLDLATLSPADREAIAAVCPGGPAAITIPVPTVDALIEAARAHVERNARAAAAANARQREEDARKAARTAELRKIIDERIVEERPWQMPGGHSYLEISPKYASTYGEPPELQRAYEAFQAECRAESMRRKAAVQDEIDRQTKEAVAARAAMPISDLVTADGRISGVAASQPSGMLAKRRDRICRIVRDTGTSLLLAASSDFAPFIRYYDVPLYTNGKVTTGVEMSDDEARKGLIDAHVYDVADGVLSISSASCTWVAVVADPSAVKPVYDFCRRAPGGYVAPTVTRGDVIVWGGKDKKGRKVGPYDRLVVKVEDGKIYTVQVDYVTARKLRKVLLGA